MLVWCAILFLIGVAAFLDSLFNYGEIFRQVNSVFFLLLSLGILVRTTTKMKSAQMEQMYNRIDELERKVSGMNREKEQARKRSDSLY